MSFSSEIKEELSHHSASARHCRIAELTAIITLCGGISISSQDRLAMKLHTENPAVARKAGFLLHAVFGIAARTGVRSHSHGNKGRVYCIGVPSHEDTVRVLEACHLLGEGFEIEEDLSTVSNVILRKACCRRAFLRGAFLVTGSVSDPHRAYHYELTAPTYAKALQMTELIGSFGVEAHIVERKAHFVVYVKEGEGIVDLLNIMEAHKALMDLENIRILREISNNVNRKVNCETANLNKTIKTAVKQVADIEYLRDHMGLESLPEALQETARVRLEYADVPLSQLGALMNPPVGKSGVNHRLHKLSEMADQLRSQEGKEEEENE